MTELPHLPPDSSSSLRLGKTNAFLIILFICLLSVMAFLELAHLEKQTKTTTVEALDTVLKTTQNGLRLWTRDTSNIVALWGRSEQLAYLTEQQLKHKGQPRTLRSSKSLTYMRNMFDQWIPAQGGIGFSVISPEGINIAADENSTPGASHVIYRERPDLFARILAGETLFIPPLVFVDTITKQPAKSNREIPMAYIAAPILNSTRTPIGVFAFCVDPTTTLSEIAGSGRIGQTGETYFLDQQGRLMSKSRFHKQLLDIGLLAPGESGIYNLEIRDPGLDLRGENAFLSADTKPKLTRMAANVTQKRNGTSTSPYRDYRGIPVLGAWLWDKELNIGIASEISAEEALEPYFLNRKITILSFSLTGLLAIFFSYALFALGRHTDRLNSLSYVDSLTNVGNRRHFDATLDTQWKIAVRSKLEISLILIDIDKFKEYNDFYGHQAGDTCIQTIADIIKRSVRRAGDLIARYGGEEFVVLMPMTTKDESLKLAESMFKAISNKRIPNEGSSLSEYVTVSMGVASIKPTPETDQQFLFENADKALYRAKQAGRNKICH